MHEKLTESLVELVCMLEHNHSLTYDQILEQEIIRYKNTETEGKKK